jgi:hypothetical protein
MICIIIRKSFFEQIFMDIKSKKIAKKLLLILPVMMAFVITSQVFAEVLPQQPTISVPTVTSTSSGPKITVRLDADQKQINVRSGPGTYYDKVGVLLIGQQAPAKGRSAGGEWILIDYPGIQGGLAWVYAPLVELTGGTVPIVEPPPTPTPIVTPTIDPTLAAQFVVTSAPTRLPTYTAPPPLTIPTFKAQTGLQAPGGIPMGLVIISLFGAGAILGFFTLARNR